jgi:hypothetical protein
MKGLLVGDVEELSDLLGGLALDHVGNGLAPNVATNQVQVPREVD